MLIQNYVKENRTMKRAFFNNALVRAPSGRAIRYKSSFRKTAELRAFRCYPSRNRYNNPTSVVITTITFRQSIAPNLFVGELHTTVTIITPKIYFCSTAIIY